VVVCECGFSLHCGELAGSLTMLTVAILPPWAIDGLGLHIGCDAGRFTEDGFLSECGLSLC
jgi:hypothetical protein